MIFTRHPVDNPVISQPFGVANTWENPPWHKGIDYAAALGTPIKAPADMFIVYASMQPFQPGNPWEQVPGSTASGNCIIGQLPAPHTATQTSFSHLSRIDVKPGQYVKAGQVIGAIGSTGNSSGPHLHWEAFIDYNEGSYPEGTFYGRVNPLEYFITETVVPIQTGGKGSTNTEGNTVPETVIVKLDRNQAEDIAKRAAALTVAELRKNPISISAVQAESIAARAVALGKASK